MSYDFSCLNIPPQAGPLVELAECLCSTIAEDCGLSLCWCGIYPGGVPAWDYCGGCSGGTCGMGYVSMDGASLYTSFGSPAFGMMNCASLTQASVTIGVLRCMPLEEDGSPPDVETMADVAMLLMADMMAIRRAATCCFKGDLILGGYEPLGVSGGCTGGQWRATVALD